MYGRLIPVSETIVNNRPAFLCDCTCGKQVNVRASRLSSGHTKSCGCLRSDTTKATHTTGISPLQRVYNTIKAGALYRATISKNSDKYVLALSVDQVHDLIIQPCHYCGRQGISKTKTHAGVMYHNGIDRIDNNIGYVIDNVIPACKFCNKLKGDLPYTTFIQLISKIANHMKI